MTDLMDADLAAHDVPSAPHGENEASAAKRPSLDRDSVTAFLARLNDLVPPSAQEQKRLARAVVAGDENARSAMILGNMRLVVHWAKRYQGQGLEMADLIQEGMFGLFRAVDRYNPAKGYQFSTYASWWIRNAMQKAIFATGRTITVPMAPAMRAAAATAATAELHAKLQRMPTDAEVAECIGGNVEEINKIRTRPWVAVSLDQPIADGDTTISEGTLSSDGGAEANEALEHVAAEERRTRVREALKHLAPIEADVIRLRFGLDRAPCSYPATAEALHITMYRVKELEVVAMRKLSEVLAGLVAV